VERRRVVISGLGTISPVGNTVSAAWYKVRNGISGIGPLTRFDSSPLKVHIAGEVHGFDPKEHFGHREARRMDRVTQLAMIAVQEALAHSGLDLASIDPYRIGCIVSSCLGGIETLMDQAASTFERGITTASPVMLPMILTNTTSGRIAMEYNLRGPNMGITTACATGNNAIGESAEMIRRGAADVILAGGSEAAILPLTVSSLSNMTALSHRNDSPETASRPFDKTRDGFILSEGAGVLVLEALDHALARNAPIFGEIIGYGTTNDAYHVTAPRVNGEAAGMAMLFALRDAGIAPGEVDYINAHGTSTPLNDSSETEAIKRVWGETAYDIPISSTKSTTGHLIGASGAIEAIFSLKAIEDSFIPPTANLHTPDPDCDLNYTPNVGVSKSLNIVVSNNFGFGGHNAVIVLKKWTPAAAEIPA